MDAVQFINLCVWWITKKTANCSMHTRVSNIILLTSFLVLIRETKIKPQTMCEKIGKRRKHFFLVVASTQVSYRWMITTSHVISLWLGCHRCLVVIIVFLFVQEMSCSQESPGNANAVVMSPEGSSGLLRLHAIIRYWPTLLLSSLLGRNTTLSICLKVFQSKVGAYIKEFTACFTIRKNK